MKLMICGDIHWSTYSSILRSRGNNFSTRLEGLIKSMNWVEQISKEYKCDEEIFLGDTFDRPEVDSESITATREIEWNNTARLRHFIVGNHESGVSSLIYNSTQILHKMGVVEDRPYLYPLDDKTEILFLPYITEDDRLPFKEYLKNRDMSKKLIVFSHNDIKNFQMGGFISKTGFSIEEIESNCDLYINGHLHNCGKVTNKIINLGVLSGCNFSEDAFKYEHHIAILDTDTLEIMYIENPYAFNFYKIEVETESDLKQLDKLKDNAVVSIKCLNTLKTKMSQVASSKKNIIMCKAVFYSNADVSDDAEVKTIAREDHIEQFRKYIIETLGNSDIVKDELSEVCK